MKDFNPKVAADGQGTFCFKCSLMHLQILSAVFHTFLKIKTFIFQIYSFPIDPAVSGDPML